MKSAVMEEVYADANGNLYIVLGWRMIGRSRLWQIGTEQGVIGMWTSPKRLGLTYLGEL